MEKEIELLEEAPPSKIRKIATTTTRKVGIPLAIIIQIIFLVLAYLSYQLNQDLRELSEEVAEYERTLSQMEDTKEVLGKTQDKLEVIADVKEGFCYPCAIKKLEELAAPLSKIDDASIEEEKIVLSAEAPPGPYFAQFVSTLIEEEVIKEAVLTAGRLCQKGFFSFTIELTLDESVLTKDE
jgi:hypothetical protein